MVYSIYFSWEEGLGRVKGSEGLWKICDLSWDLENGFMGVKRISKVISVLKKDLKLVLELVRKGG